MEHGVGVGLDQVLQDTCWAHDRIKRTTKVLRHRGLGLAYQRGFRFGASVEDDVATREHCLDVREASAFERALQLHVLCIHRAYAAKERDITRHRLSLVRAARRRAQRRAAGGASAAAPGWAARPPLLNHSNSVFVNSGDGSRSPDNVPKWSWAGSSRSCAFSFVATTDRSNAKFLPRVSPGRVSSLRVWTRRIG